MKQKQEEPKYWDDPAEVSTEPRYRFKKSIYIAIVAIFTVGIGNTLATNINLNTDGQVEFGQGVALSAICDSNITVSPYSAFQNSSNAGGHTLSGFRISDVDTTSCQDVTFTIKAYGETSSIPVTLFSNDVEANIKVGFSGFSLISDQTGMTLSNTSSTSATIAFNFPSALTSTIRKITIESTKESKAGGKIVYQGSVSGTYDIFVMSSDGSSRINLTNHSSYDFDPDWSPDGKQIVFASSRSGGSEIYKMQADGSNLIRVTTNADEDWGPAWSPDGTKIAFVSRRGTNNQIFVMNSDGGSLTQLTNFTDTSTSWGQDGSPRWSPNGEKIVFWHYTAGSKGNPSEIYTMNSDGSGLTAITSNSAYSYFPDWSPSGNKIVFAINGFSRIEIYSINSDGTNQTRLTFDSGFKFDPAWSPDGTKIVYDVDGPNIADNYIYTMNADGTNQVQLPGGLGGEFKPRWRK